MFYCNNNNNNRLTELFNLINLLIFVKADITNQISILSIPIPLNSIWSIPYQIHQFQIEQFQFNSIYSAGVVGDNHTTWEVSRSRTSWDSSFWHQSSLKRGSSVVASLKSFITSHMGPTASQYWLPRSRNSESGVCIANFNSKFIKFQFNFFK